MNNKPISNLATPNPGDYAAKEAYVNSKLSNGLSVLQVEGDVLKIRKRVGLTSNTITGLANPVNASDPASKGYVGAITGETVFTGHQDPNSVVALKTFNMNSSSILDLPSPTSDNEATTKEHVDATSTKVNSIPIVIPITASINVARRITQILITGVNLNIALSTIDKWLLYFTIIPVLNKLEKK
jgi:hypothetical protein